MNHFALRSWILISVLGASLLACSEAAPPPPAETAEAEEKTKKPSGLDVGAVRERAKSIFGVLPVDDENPENPFSEEKIKLGRMLYFDTRLSKNHDVSCNSCHQLNRYGVDNEPTSPGHKGQRGGRNSPTVYNASLHIAQFWDGRAKDVEEQAGGPVLNPIEMAMPSEEAVLTVLNSIDDYRTLFARAFPTEGGESAVTYANMANAIGAFERKLMTPAAFDAFLAGDDSALTDKEVRGLETFMDTGCIQCHMGPALGGSMFQKLGLIKPFGSEDAGRFEVTGNEADRGVFKVPSLRNVAQTEPYLHDGSIKDLDAMIRIMAEHQLGKTLSGDEVKSIRTFLGSLTGKIDPLYTAKPDLPESGPDTPAPDPT